MKVTALILMSGLATFAASARTLNINSGQVTYAFPAATMGEAVCDGAGSLTVMGRVFPVKEISGLYVDDSEVDDNTVSVTYSGISASVTIAGNIARYVSASVDGAHVSIVQADDVSDATCGEITYVLSGESADGAFLMEGSYKSSLELRGLRLASQSGAAIDIQNGKRIEVSVKNGTENYLSDAAGGSQKGAISCKGHLEFKGKGFLQVEGNAAHAIYAKEYVQIKNCTINITSAVKDGINCTQHFLMESGELNVSGTGDDGIQADFKDAADREDEDTGTITIAGGKINLVTDAVAAKCLKAEGNVVVTGGELTALASGKGKWDADKAKTKAASCISADMDFLMSGGVIDLSATGSGGKGISCDGTLTIDGGDITVNTTGGVFAYVNGTEYDGYTGSTDRLDSDAKSSPKGMKADTEIVINGGKIDVTTTGNGGEGIESKGILTVNDGIVNVRSYDDALNSSSHMYIKGGDITVIASNNDGLDSNGNLYIMGGTVRAFGAGAPECGIDANEEEGYSVFFTGGTLLAVGGGNSVPSKDESAQPYISGSATLSPGMAITLKDGETILASFTVPDDYAGNSAGGTGGPGGRPGGMGPGGRGGGLLITCAGLVSGNTYTLSAGSSTTAVTAVLKGSGGGRPW